MLALVEVDDLGEALEFVNGSRYGNAVSDLHILRSGAVRRYRAEVEAGMIGVNVGVPAPVAWFPFAGWKDSMVGDLHANGTDAIQLLHAPEEGRHQPLVTDHFFFFFFFFFF